MIPQLDLRPSPIAGQWYPADPRRLAASIDGYLDAARLPQIEGEIVAIMAPHAGHIYSGPVAGYAFAALRGLAPQLVAVVAPLHYPSYYPVLTTAHAAYSTPLGPVPVDHEALSTLDAYLQADLGLGLAQVRNDPEHSLEIELPFLQRALGHDFRLLPVMIHQPEAELAHSLGRGLAQVISSLASDHPASSPAAILVASTDLSHFFPKPVAASLDGEVLRLVQALDPEGLLRADEEGRGLACGRGALAAVLWAAQELGANSAQILHYATSGDITGDFDRVVGYASAVITR